MKFLNSIMVLTMGVAGSWFVVPVPTAEAQTATNLDCVRCVQRREIANLAVGQQQLGNSSVFSVKIRDRSIQGVDVNFNALGSNEITGLRDFDMTDEAGADGTTGGVALSTSADRIVVSIGLSAPTSGQVIVNASGTLIGGGSASANKRVNCSLNRNTTALESSDRLFKDWNTVQDGFAMTEFFANVPSGTSFYRLVCRQFGGTSAVTVTRADINATFLPTRY